MNAYEKGKIRKGEVLLEGIDFAIDTAGSWEGTFPKVDKGDYVVKISDQLTGEDSFVLVSRRYTGAVDYDNAAELALDALVERRGYGDTAMGDSRELVEVELVNKVMK